MEEKGSQNMVEKLAQTSGKKRGYFWAKQVKSGKRDFFYTNQPILYTLIHFFST